MAEPTPINTSVYPNQQFNNSNNEIPHDFQAEQSVLGCLMLESDDLPLWERVAIVLRENDFFDPRHQAIYRSCARLHEKSKYADLVTLTADLKEFKELDIIGGQSYLIELSNVAPSVSSVEAYAKIVKDCSLKRKLITICSEAVKELRTGSGKDVSDLFEQLQQKFYNISDETVKEQQGPRLLGELLEPAIIKIKSNIEIKGGITGVPTGFTNLDKLTTGFHGGELIIIAARPAMGKTTFAMNIVQHVFMNPIVQYPSIVFSLEMPAWQLLIRMISSVSQVQLSKINEGSLTADEFAKLINGFQVLGTRKNYLYIDDRGGLSPMQISAEIRKIHKEYGGIGLVMIDYLQLMRLAGYENNKQQEVSEISAALKRIAKEFDVPVVALSQLNRGLENRTEKRPMNSDLRESGAIEQDADVIMFIYRDEVYHKETKDKGLAEIILGKQRNGPIGTVKLVFQGEYSSFVNLNTHDDYGEMQ